MTIDEKLIQQCDQDIRAGHPQHAAERLAKLNSAQVTRDYRLPLAKICRRAGLTSLGLTLLSPLIHSPFKSEAPYTPAELAEYSVLLMRAGAVAEAVEKLKQVDISQAPEALLYQAYGLFLNWEFKEAVPVLEQYLTTPLPEYEALVAKANLAFALVEEQRHPSVLSLTEEIIGAGDSTKHQQLRGTCHSLRAQVFIQERHFSQARAELESARRLYDLADTNDHFLLTKWNLILQGLESKSTRPFADLKKMAAKFHDWEACREADLYSLLIDFSRGRFVHLYFGSPFAGFRKRMLAELGSLPSQPMYVLGPKSAPRFDLRTGQVDGATALNSGKKIHQLLQVLLTDFYRPLRIGGLFAQMFPDEQFDISSSPGRVHQILRRTRTWMKENQIPAVIDETDEYYSLKLAGNFSFRIPLDFKRVDPHESQFERLMAVCGENPFSMKEACTRLGISEATLQRLIKAGLKEGRIEDAGKMNRTRLYRLKPRNAAEIKAS